MSKHGGKSFGTFSCRSKNRRNHVDEIKLMVAEWLAHREEKEAERAAQLIEERAEEEYRYRMERAWEYDLCS